MTSLHRRIAATRFAAGLAVFSASATILLSLTGASCAAPQTEPALTATLAKTGEVTVRRGERPEALVSIHAGLFEPGWQMHAASFDAGSQTTRITATTAGSIVTVAPTVTTDGKTMHVSCSFTADKDTPLNSLQVSVTLPIARYISGTALLDGGTAAPLVIPANGKDVQLIPSTANGLTLTAPDGSQPIHVAPTGPKNTLLLQDNRPFGGTDLEIRVGVLAEHTLKAGQAETVAFDVVLPESFRLEKETPLTLTAGPDWIPLSPSSLDIVPGSALDFSQILPNAPTGKYGRVVVRSDGHFGFAKGAEPVRFYGVNLCFTANYLTHAEADAFAERLARLGYNAVRVHHYESDLIDQSQPDSLTFRADNLDKLDYLMAAFHRHGIYVTTDLFVSRPVRPAEMGLDTASGDDFKDVVLVSRPAMENWKAFSKNLLTHVNPYTKLAYKDDPTLAFISVINEPSLTDNRIGTWKGKLRDLFAAEWKTWLEKRYPGDAVKSATPLPTSLDDNATGRDLGAFFAYLHARGYAEMKTFLRTTVGTQALLTYLNGWSETPAQTTVRPAFDYVDNHFYWDHPSFLGQEWGLPSTGSNGNGSAVDSEGAGPDRVAMSRIFGKPFTVTEWDYVAPNRYRAEGEVLMGAAASLQGWDGIWHFAYSHSHDGIVTPQPTDYFNVGLDPLRQASERTALLMFRRADVRTAPNQAVAYTTAKSLLAPGDHLPVITDYRDLTLVRRVGMSFDAPGLPDTLAIPIPKVKGGVRNSETGEIFLDSDAETLAVYSPRTSAVVVPAGGTLTSGPLTVQAQDARAVVAVSSLDGKSSVLSHHLLITHLTDLQNSGERFSAQDRRIVEVWGGLPYLVRRGSATVTLKRTDSAPLHAWRLDTTGKRIASVPMKVAGQELTLDLSTAAPDGSATLYYEIAE